MVPDIPVHVIQEERIVCSIMASLKYGVPANIMLAVAEKEGGRPGLWSPNKNGTHDVGSMQFNTAYLDELAPYGITPEAVASPGCYPYDLAAWRLRKHLKEDASDIWTKASYYHSRTPKYNGVYRADLQKKAQKWEAWLAARFDTVAVNGVQHPRLRLPAVTYTTLSAEEALARTFAHPGSVA